MSQIDSRKNFLFVNSIRKGIWGGGEKWMYEVGTGFRKKGYGVIYCGRPSSRRDRRTAYSLSDGRR